MLVMELDQDPFSSGSRGRHGCDPRCSRPTWHVWGTAYALIFIFINSQLIYTFIPAEELDSPTFSTILANFLSFHVTGLVIIVVTIWLFVQPGQRAKEVYLDKGFSLAVVTRAVKITTCLVPAVAVLNIGILALMKKLHWPVSEDPMTHWLLTAPPYILLLLTFGAVVIAPVAEEIMFRLVLYNTFRQFFGKRFANLSTSLLFAVFHLRPEQVIPLFILALILQKSLNRSQNILLPITIHSLFNGVMITLALIARYYHTP